MSQRELEILNILWGSNKPMSSMDIIEKSSRLSQSTVQAVLRKLLKEGLIEVTGNTHSGNVLCRLFKPTEISKEIVLKWYVENYFTIENIVSWSEVEEMATEMLKSGE